MTLALEALRLWKSSVIGTKLPWFWLIIRPILTLLPFLTIIFVFVDGGAGLFVLYVVSLSATLTYFFRNCFRVEKLIRRYKSDLSRLSFNDLLSVLFIRSAFEFMTPAIVIISLTVRSDLIVLSKWCLMIFLELLVAFKMAKALVPVVIVCLEKWEDTRHFLRYINAIFNITMFLMFKLVMLNTTLLSVVAAFPLLSSYFSPILLYVSISDTHLALLILLKLLSVSLIIPLNHVILAKFPVKRSFELVDDEAIE